MTRTILLFLVLLSGCSMQPSSQEIKKLTINLQEGDPPSLHPSIGVDLRSRCLSLALFEPLMRRDPMGQLVPAAAESIELDSTGCLYTFHIRPHQWSNGQQVTSEHFLQGWRYALSPRSPCVRADLFYPIENAEAVKKGELPVESVKVSAPDEKTLIVELRHPTPYFLDLTASSFFAPLYQETGEEPTCFNGPFIVGERVHDQKLVLRKNPYYWDQNSVELEEIHFTFVKSPLTALAMYEKGELDVVGDPFSSLPLEAIPGLEASNELKKKLVSRIFYLLLNTTLPPFTEPSIRKAFSFSIDRDQLVEHLFFGEIPTLSLLPTTLSLEPERYHHSQEDPRELLEQGLHNLGLTREHFPKVVLSFAELSGQKKLGEFLQEQWRKKLGIEVELVCSEWNVHAANLRNRNFQMGTLHLTTHYQDPAFYFDLYRDRQSKSNYCGWEDSEFQKLMDASEKTNDSQFRKELLTQAERLLHSQTPAIPLFTQNFQYLVQDGVDLVISDLGIYDFKWTRKQ